MKAHSCPSGSRERQASVGRSSARVEVVGLGKGVGGGGEGRRDGEMLNIQQAAAADTQALPLYIEERKKKELRSLVCPLYLHVYTFISLKIITVALFRAYLQIRSVLCTDYDGLLFENMEIPGLDFTTHGFKSTKTCQARAYLCPFFPLDLSWGGVAPALVAGLQLFT